MVVPALAVIWLSVALGAALGVGQRFAPSAADPIRTFAVVAAALVVVLSLLPDALGSEALGGVLAVLIGYAAIPVLERLGLALARGADSRAVRLELGYLGLLLHRFGDGVAMSVDGHGHGLLWALGAHEIPIVALVTLAFARRGWHVALARAGALGLSSSLGLWLVHATPAPTWHALHGWADALAAGVLIHIVVHEGFGEPLPAPSERSGVQRALDVAAALAALALIALPALRHDVAAQALCRRLLELACATAPLIAFGLGFLALGRAWRLPLFGGPSVSPGPSAASLVAGAALSPPALALSAALLGWRFALCQATLGGALGVLAGVCTRHDTTDSLRAPAAASPDETFAARWWSELNGAITEFAGWIALGLLAACLVEQCLPASSVAAGGPLQAWGWMLGIAALSSLCTPAAAPLAAALIGQGMGAGLALAGLLLGSPLRLGRTALASGTRSHWATLGAAIASGAAACGLGLLAPNAIAVRQPSASARDWGVVGALLLAALVAITLRRIWQSGVRGWLQASLPAPVPSQGHVACHSHQTWAVPASMSDLTSARTGE
jgi:hypothetical protein